MAQITVGVRTVMIVVYEWTCPHCGKRTSLDFEGDSYENRTQQCIYCKSCRGVVFRQEPGIYSTERQ